MDIIGICGFIGSGKDSIGNVLIKERGYVKLSFASVLKDIVSLVFGWDRKMLEGDTQESRKWREDVDEWWSKRLNIDNLTPRWVLQNWGTDVLRNHFHEDIWLASLERKIINSGIKKVVITDCRFENEANFIKKLGGRVILVVRDSQTMYSNHPSETTILKLNFDLIIHNYSTLEDLEHIVRNIV